ncbi:MAG TPA: anti-sigma factor [Roseiarcus sp.]
MNSRPITEDDLNAFVDRRLDPGRQAEVAAYLDAHPEVAKRIEGYARQRDQLRTLLRPIADEPIPPELNVRRLVELQERPSRSNWWAAAAAAIVLTVFSGASGWMLRGMSEPPLQGVASLGHEAVDNYAVYTPDRLHPVELRAVASNELVDWVSQRLGRRVEIPNLEASGYRFMGGRVVATPHGPAALFMYDNDHGVRLVMLSRPMAVDQGAPMQPVSQGDVSGFSWAAKGMGYSLVGPADSQTLHPIADEVRRQVSSAA